MNQLAAFLGACASVAALVAWSRAVPTRALGDARCSRRRALGEVALIVAVQLAVVIAALGPAGGSAVVACAWMLLGWPFCMALNAWPERTLAWSRRGGRVALGVAAAVVLLR